MAGAVIAFVFGVLQAFLLKVTLFSFTEGNYRKAAVFMILKLAFYGAAAMLLA